MHAPLQHFPSGGVHVFKFSKARCAGVRDAVRGLHCPTCTDVCEVVTPRVSLRIRMPMMVERRSRTLFLYFYTILLIVALSRTVRLTTLEEVAASTHCQSIKPPTYPMRGEARKNLHCLTFASLQFSFPWRHTVYS